MPSTLPKKDSMIETEEIVPQKEHHFNVEEAFGPPAKLVGRQVETFEGIQQQLLELAQSFQRNLPECDEKSLALRALQESKFWANETIAKKVIPF